MRALNALGTAALALGLLAGCNVRIEEVGQPSSAPVARETPNRNSVVYRTPTPRPDVATARALPLPSPVTVYSGPQTAVVTLEDGRTFTIKMRGDKAPRTVENFVKRAQAKAYDGLIFHRVEDWVVQGGDPKGDGTGGGTLPAEYNDLPFTDGAVGIARGMDRNLNNDMQFFVVTRATPSLDRNYTNFGTVTEGMDVVRSIARGARIKTVTVR